jgi:RNA polymerase sigma factor (sigma-70 family)
VVQLVPRPAGAAHAAAIIGRVDRTDRADDDHRLLAEFAAGSMSAFARLFERHERAVWRFLRRQLGDAALADDLLQEVWMAVIRNAASFEPRAKFSTWLYTIARSKLIDHWRAQRPNVSLDEPAANDDEVRLVDSLAADPDAQPEVLVTRREQAEHFIAALEALPLPQREAFLLHTEAGLTVEEVAEATGVGRETAKSRLRYAMARLRDSLKAWQ